MRCLRICGSIPVVINNIIKACRIENKYFVSVCFFCGSYRSSTSYFTWLLNVFASSGFATDYGLLFTKHGVAFEIISLLFFISSFLFIFIYIYTFTHPQMYLQCCTNKIEYGLAIWLYLLFSCSYCKIWGILHSGHLALSSSSVLWWWQPLQ